jgi:exonuclease SbcC
MITRVELTNFMSHKHTVIEPAEGLTVLVGPNNVGKSAIVAALQILCHNETSTYVQRHGERECSVKVHTDDGHVVEWRRKTAPSYIIDGQVFDRLRNGLPDELAAALRLRKVDAGGDADFDVHFGTQKSPIFLLGSSAANAARFFASSSDAIRLVTIQKRHKEKLAEAQREKIRLEARSRRVNAELGVLEPVVEVDHRLAEAERTFEELTQLRASINEAARYEAELRRQHHVVAERGAHADALAVLLSPPAMHDVGSLAQLKSAIAGHAKHVEKEEEDRRALSVLSSPPDMADVGALQELMEELAASARNVALATARHAALQAVTSPPPVTPTEEITTVIAQLKQADREARLRTSELQAANAELASAAQELRTLATGRACPVCGIALDPDRIVARAAAALGGHDHE